MIAKHSLSLLLAAAAFIPSAKAELPSLDDKIWLGYFAGHSCRDCLLGVSTKCDISFQLEPEKVKGSNGAGILPHSCTSIIVGIEEDMPDGKPSIRTIRPESLETKDDPTSKLEKTVITGKVTGDAAFELTIERDRSSFILSNRLIDPGKLTKNPIRPVVSLRIPTIYQHDKDGEASKTQIKERKKDSLDVKWTDGKRKKLDLSDSMDASTKEVNGPGVSIAQVDAGGIIRGRKITAEAPEGVSILKIDNPASQPLNSGLRFTAIPAPAKPGAKPGDTARLVISVR